MVRIYQGKPAVRKKPLAALSFDELCNKWIPGNTQENAVILPPLLNAAVREFMPKGQIGRARYKREQAEKIVLFGIYLGDRAGEPFETRLDLPDDPNLYLTQPLILPKSHYTDDTVMSFAIKKAVEEQYQEPCTEETVFAYASALKEFAKKYPNAGYGGHFYQWAIDDVEDPRYKSFGNGGAMRAGVIGAVCDTVQRTIEQAVCSALPSHSHPEGVKAAVVTAVAVFLALHGASMGQIMRYMFRYYDSPDAVIRARMTTEDLIAMSPHSMSLSSQRTMPEVIINLNETDSLEGCIRNTFRYVCDADTVGAISGGIAAAYYGEEEVRKIKRKIKA